MDEHCPIERDINGNIVRVTCPYTDEWHERLGRLKDKMDLLRGAQLKDNGKVQR